MSDDIERNDFSLSSKARRRKNEPVPLDARRIGRAASARLVKVLRRRGGLLAIMIFGTCLFIFFGALAGIGYVDPDVSMPEKTQKDREFVVGGPVFDPSEGQKLFEAEMQAQREREMAWRKRKRPNAGAWMNQQRNAGAVRIKDIEREREGHGDGREEWERVRDAERAKAEKESVDRERVERERLERERVEREIREEARARGEERAREEARERAEAEAKADVGDEAGDAAEEVVEEAQGKEGKVGETIEAGSLELDVQEEAEAEAEAGEVGEGAEGAEAETETGDKPAGPRRRRAKVLKDPQPETEPAVMPEHPRE